MHSIDRHPLGLEIFANRRVFKSKKIIIMSSNRRGISIRPCNADSESLPPSSRCRTMADKCRPKHMIPRNHMSGSVDSNHIPRSIYNVFRVWLLRHRSTPIREYGSVVTSTGLMHVWRGSLIFGLILPPLFQSRNPFCRQL